MTTTVWIDVRLIQDGSARWLWQLLSEGMLHGAGVAMSRADAQAQAEQRLHQLHDRNQVVAAIQGGPDWKTAMMDLDAIDRLDREDRQALREQARAEERDRHDHGEPVG